MKLKQNIYKSILSVLLSNSPEFKSAQNLVLFNRILSAYPSNRGYYYMTAQRVISYIDRGIWNTDLILDIMRDEGEDEEVIKTLITVRDSPAINTTSELAHLITILSNYLKYNNILKVKKSFISSMDMIDDDNDTSIKNNVEKVYHYASEIVNAYDVANIQVAQHNFDTSQPEMMKNVVAHAKDSNDATNIIITGIRSLNSLLSPGYVNGALYVYAALPANYKSGILLESHVDVLRFNKHIKENLNGKIPVSIYISMENNMSQTVKRLWSILYPNVDIQSYSVDDATKMLNDALTQDDFRSVIQYYGYREKSTKDIADIIRSMNNDQYQVVAVFLDYIKRIRPSRTDIAATSSEKTELNVIMNELKAIAVEFDIPIITAHQLNRSGAQALDDAARNGGSARSDILLGRSNVSCAWEIVEASDWLGIINIDNVGDEKYLMIKAAKQREKDGSDQSLCLAYRQPFISPTSFALMTDVNENVSLGVPLYSQLQQLNYQANT